MVLIFAADLNLSPLAIGAIIVSAVGFLVMFGIASAKGGFQDLVSTTLKNDALQREQLKKKSNDSK